MPLRGNSPCVLGKKGIFNLFCRLRAAKLCEAFLPSGAPDSAPLLRPLKRYDGKSSLRGGNGPGIIKDIMGFWIKTRRGSP